MDWIDVAVVISGFGLVWIELTGCFETDKNDDGFTLLFTNTLCKCWIYADVYS